MMAELDGAVLLRKKRKSVRVKLRNATHNWTQRTYSVLENIAGPLVAKNFLAQQTRQRYSLPIIPANEYLSNTNGVNSGASSVSAQSSPYHSNRNPLAMPSIAANRISTSEPGDMLLSGESKPAAKLPPCDHDMTHFSAMPSIAANRISTSEPGDMLLSGESKPAAKLSPCDRLERIMFELIETERAYVDDLEAVISRYLGPMRDASLLVALAEELLQSTKAVQHFQKRFLESLQDAAGADFIETKTFPNPSQLRNSLMLLGGVFVNQAPKFKLYSSFCAAHFKLQKMLQQNSSDSDLQEFLLSRNLNRQHSSTLESYLIKPVQRVLRYPLFLQQMKALTTAGTPEHMQVSEALLKMEKIAGYINDMQRIYEEHGTRFSQLQTENKDTSITLDLSSLLMCGEVEWLNSEDSVASRRRSTSSHPSAMTCHVFVFQTALVLLGQPRDRRKNSKGETPTLQRLIPMREVEVNGSDVGSSQNQHIWILIHMDQTLKVEKVYHFANRRAELKTQFLKSVRKAGLSLSRASSAGSNSPYVRQRNKTHSSHETMVLKDPSPPVPAAPARYHSSNSPVTAQRTLTTANGTGHAVNGAPKAIDPAGAMSSPDSGYLNARNLSPRYLTPRGCDAKRPGSYHSSQSDAGYGSNTELQPTRKLELVGATPNS